jgi:CMP-N-acetylneuraminic acid synthetase
MKEVFAFVHAKGTSERVPCKNLKLLGDRPLFCHAIAIAKAASSVTHVVIDSDSDEILRIGAEHGAIPLKRSPDLATNTTTGDDLAFWQASNAPGSNFVVQVIPTSPFLKPESVDAAIEMLRSTAVDSVVGVFREPLYLWKNGRPTYFLPDGRIPNSVDLEPTVAETTGLYANRTQFVLQQRKRMNPDNCAPLFLSKLEAIDINTWEDFTFAETVWRGLHQPR